MKVFSLILFALVSFNFTSASNTAPNNKPNHAEWNRLLGKYVDQKGNVNYKGFKKDALALSTYLEGLAKNAPTDQWSKDEKLAYYINLYNAATVKLILDNYPVKSIKDIKGPWDQEWVKIGNKTYSLGNIEHKILRKMNEPRIHFAINCASYSCPKLVNTAYLPATMEAQLQKATFSFINDTTRNNISENELQLSNIFKWYKSDFTTTVSLQEYLKPYSKIAISTDAKVKYNDYDWSLNEIK
ncbi:DUF547 domain-containing protein [Cellulophaga sp. HaHa_2_95]|uniref:DUF547 domain-containing protein n=1 Tax=unclassified Cellulophaga TaxID=2634405 RepID=UPI001C4FF0DE|nr:MULTISPECIES: DUF547 domain-containing protein [unclassified Cellulophaga]QXP50600.1 DUF547 domain-containing protein [Cellulophaga sp. HaHa_2_1]QXP57077.1 DUF547 domain-containing protein [Cellulophaga sp. HaHa_2_95]